MSPACCFLPIGPLGNVANVSAAAAGADWVNVAPNWITAIATVGLLAGAIFTVIYAVRAFRAQTAELGVLKAQRDRDNDERRRAQAARVFIGIAHDPGRLVAPYAENASDFPVFDAQFWHPWAEQLSGPENLGMILPHKRASISPRFNAEDALAHTILTFRDAEGIRWVRMPDGTFDEQTRDTARESVLAALGKPLPVAAQAAPAAEPAGQPGEPEAPAGQ